MWNHVCVISERAQGLCIVGALGLEKAGARARGRKSVAACGSAQGPYAPSQRAPTRYGCDGDNSDNSQTL